MIQDSLHDMTTRLQTFAKERDWEQFHQPKNLVLALCGEAGELAAEFQWLTAEESERLEPERLEQVRMESADVLLYLVRLADRLGFDLVEAAHQKIDLNAARYPADRVRGSARKYNEY